MHSSHTHFPCSSVWTSRYFLGRSHNPPVPFSFHSALQKNKSLSLSSLSFSTVSLCPPPFNPKHSPSGSARTLSFLSCVLILIYKAAFVPFKLLIVRLLKGVWENDWMKRFGWFGTYGDALILFLYSDTHLIFFSDQIAVWIILLHICKTFAGNILQYTTATFCND